MSKIKKKQQQTSKQGSSLAGTSTEAIQSYKLPAYDAAYQLVFEDLYQHFIQYTSPLPGILLQSSNDKLERVRSCAANQLLIPAGRSETQEFEITEERRVKAEEILSGNFESLLDLANEMAECASKQVSKPLYDYALQSGAMIECTLSNLETPAEFYEQVLQNLDRIEISFDDQLRPILEQSPILVSPELYRKLAGWPPPSADVNARYQAIIERKREEWCARKRTRRLS